MNYNSLKPIYFQPICPRPCPQFTRIFCHVRDMKEAYVCVRKIQCPCPHWNACRIQIKILVVFKIVNSLMNSWAKVDCPSTQKWAVLKYESKWSGNYYLQNPIYLRTQTIYLDFSWFPCEPAWEIILDKPTDKGFPLVCCQPRLITVKPRVSPAFPFLTSTRYDSNDGIGKKEFPWWQPTTRLRFKILRFVFQRKLCWWCLKRYRQESPERQIWTFSRFWSGPRFWNFLDHVPVQDF